MKKTHLTIVTLFSFMALLTGCSYDYFTRYDSKDLIQHLSLADWTLSVSTTYMDYSTVTAAVAGTSGLPDAAAAIYRIENLNLVPDGDFEATTPDTNSFPAGWDNSNADAGDGVESGSPIDGQALRFDEGIGEYLTYDVNTISDGAITDSNYLLRFDLSGDNTGNYYFRIEDTSGSGNVTTYSANLLQKDTVFSFPSDFSSISLTEFLIHTADSEIFQINLSDVTLQAGYIDNFRIVKSDQDQNISIEIPYYDESRVDSLDLISGWYRFSVRVKADPNAGVSNTFAADAVSLSISSLDDEGLASRANSLAFSASDYSSFSEWTEIYIDAELQITVPYWEDTAVIKLQISPGDITAGASGIDSGSILVSTPELYYSPDSEF